MIRTFRYPLLLNAGQSAEMAEWLEKCRALYNAALEQRKDAYRTRRRTLSYIDQTHDLTDLRASDPEWRDVPVEAQRSALRNLQRAFDGFFRRVKAGAKPGFPRFRGRGTFDSVSFPGSRVSVSGNKVKLPRIGAVKFHDYRPMRGEVLEVSVRRTPRRWMVSFACDVGDAPAKVPVRAAVGVDLGIKSFVVLSNGESVANPRFFKEAEERIAGLQEGLGRKVRGSRSRERLKSRIAREHERVADRRLDFARKLAADLYGKYDLVAYEDLNVAALAASFVSKSVADVAWRVFTRALTLKAENAGRWCVPVDGRGTSQRCSSCGRTVKKRLEERIHKCACGLVLDRDHNAALNVLALGRGALEVPGEVLTVGHYLTGAEVSDGGRSGDGTEGSGGASSG